MAVTIGQRSETESGRDVLARARARAALIPDLLIDAHTIANTVTAGWHGRRKRGSGDTFWQFRPYDSGESMARIDWRRSARDDTGIFVRDQEWEAAHTVWVWADNSPSMLYKSEMGTVSKQSRALVLALAAADVLARSGERVGWPGVMRAVAARNGAERIANHLMTSKTSPEFPPLDDVRNRSELLLVSDFLGPIDETLARLSAIARQGVRGTLLHIIDPAEERFPFTGRTRFEDPSSGEKLTFGRAETLRDDYSRIFAARKEALSDHCRRLGWHHVIHHTDELASTALVAVHTRLTLPSIAGAAA
ncbi:MAG: DUF58 domain-containing protein [Pseudomonadota bacterium]